jgi:hypothetical protein
MNRHDRRKAKSLAREVPASPKVRVLAFLEAFHKAPNDADIDIRIGASGAGEPALMVSFQGTDHALLASEARTIAQIMEESMHAHPEDPEGMTLPNIIMGLRAGCDEAERAHPNC